MKASAVNTFNSSGPNKVADYVLSYRMDAQYMSVSELAEQCYMEDATISRFCRRLRIAGYHSFKPELAKASMEGGGSRMTEKAHETGNRQSELCKQIIRENTTVLEQTAQFWMRRLLS